MEFIYSSDGNSSLISLPTCSVGASLVVLLCQPHVHSTVTAATRSCHHHAQTLPQGVGELFYFYQRQPEQTQKSSCTPQNKQDKHNTHSTGRSERMQNPSGLRWHLDIGLCAPQEIETEVKCIHSTGRLAKTALLACHMQPFHQNKAFLCRHNSSPVLQLLWLGLCAEGNCANRDGTKSCSWRGHSHSSLTLSTAALPFWQLEQVWQHSSAPSSVAPRDSAEQSSKAPSERLCRILQAHPDPSFPFLSG